MSCEHLSKLSISKLKELLNLYGIDAIGCVEKNDLVEKLFINGINDEILNLTNENESSIKFDSNEINEKKNENKSNMENNKINNINNINNKNNDNDNNINNNKEDENDLIKQFKLFCPDANDKTAKYFLEASGNDIEQAVGMFMDIGGASFQNEEDNKNNRNNLRNQKHTQNEQYYDETGIRAPDDIITDRLIGGNTNFNQPPNIQDIRNHFNNILSGNTNTNTNNNMNDVGNNNIFPPGMGVQINMGNLPDIFNMQNSNLMNMGGPQMNFGTPNTTSGILHNLKDGTLPNEDWFFPAVKAPLNEVGNFINVKQKAKIERKWLIVNIQDVTIFQSHELNRDLWNDETIKVIIESNYLLWQRSCGKITSNNDARKYMQLYNINNEELPHIGIIDPRTGKLAKKIKLPVLPNEFSILLLNFLEENEFDNFPDFNDNNEIKNNNNDNNNDIDNDSDDDNYEYDEDDDDENNIEINNNDNLDKYEIENDNKSDQNEKNDNDMYSDIIIPDEPEKGENNSTNVRIKLASGRTITRRFYTNDYIVVLFAWAKREENDENKNKEFDLLQHYPNKSLLSIDIMNRTLEDESLSNCKLTMKWLD